MVEARELWMWLQIYWEPHIFNAEQRVKNLKTYKKALDFITLLLTATTEFLISDVDSVIFMKFSSN